MSIGDKHVQPYLLCECYLVLKTLITRNRNKDESGYRDKFTYRVILFTLYGIFITLSGPVIFEGYEVIAKDLDESYYNGGEYLSLGSNNIAQIGYLLLNMATLVCIYTNRKFVENSEIRIFFDISVFISVFIGYWEYINKVWGLVPFPVDVLLGGGQYIGVAYDRFRMASLSGEASMWGPFVSASFWAILSTYRGVKDAIFLVAIFIAILLNFSGSAIVTFMFGFFMYMMHSINHMKIILVGLLLFVGYFLLDQIELFNDTIQMVSEKSDSSSGNVRLGVTMTSIMLFLKSGGLGVGLGSTRSSSFLADLLACLGIVGFILMLTIYKYLVVSRKKEIHFKFIYVYSLVVMVGQIISVPDFSYCFFWMGLFMAAGYTEETKKHQISHVL